MKFSRFRRQPKVGWARDTPAGDAVEQQVQPHARGDSPRAACGGAAPAYPTAAGGLLAARPRCASRSPTSGRSQRHGPGAFVTCTDGAFSPGTCWAGAGPSGRDQSSW